MGIGAYQLRILVENPWNGGGGYTYEQVGQMTQDQIWARLCEMDVLKREVGKRVEKTSPLQMVSDGELRGVAADGTPIKGRIRGKSKARMLMEQAEKRRREEDHGN